MTLTIPKSANEEPAPAKKLKGFAALSPERRREIASQGGRRAHEVGTAHQFTSEEGKAAVRKKLGLK